MIKNQDFPNNTIFKSIDKLPEGWSYVRSKSFLNIRKDKVGTTWSDYQLLSLTLKGIIKKDINSNEGKIPAEFDTYQKVKLDDIVLCLFDIDETPRTVGISSYEGMITGAYTVLKCDTRIVYPNYIHNYLLHVDSVKGLRPYYTGLRKVVKKDTFLGIEFPLPPLNTQREIANFLDTETTRIDSLIARKQKQIELLQEKRQAVITQAVTKGLNPDVKKKDSGVEWIGEIPEHWEVRKFSQVISIQEGQVDPSIEPYKSMTLIAPNHIESKTGILLYTETAEEQGSDSGKYLCREGDVVYSKIRPNLAKVVISPCDSLCSADMYPMRCDKKILENEFLYWLLLSDSYTRWAVLESMRVAMPKLNRETMSGYRIPVPPLNEQRELVSIIKDECLKISKIVEKIQGSINLLKEYRSSIITHAVSGQIDISNTRFQNE